MDEEKAKAFDRTVSAVLSAMDECKTINHNDIALTESGLQSVNKLLGDGILKNIKTRYLTLYVFFNAIYEKVLHRFGVFAVATYGIPSPRHFCVALAVAERVKAFRLAFACVLRFA